MSSIVVILLINGIIKIYINYTLFINREIVIFEHYFGDLS